MRKSKTKKTWPGMLKGKSKPGTRKKSKKSSSQKTFVFYNEIKNEGLTVGPYLMKALNYSNAKKKLAAKLHVKQSQLVSPRQR